jgi:hypothetical protein
MRVETFYWIISDDAKIHSVKYAYGKVIDCQKKILILAKANPGMKFHMMKRVSSVIACDLQFEDSE